jgi:hypothetical protein
MRSVAAVAVAALSVAGCESTQDRSARLGKNAHAAAAQQTFRVGKPNRSVRVQASAILRAGGSTAAVVELRNIGRRAQAQVPVLIEVRDRKGHAVYRNDLGGLDPALQQMALLTAGQRAYWVNDQVVSASPARSVTVKVGAARAAAPAKTPRIVVDQVRIVRDTGTSTREVTGRLTNASGVDQRNVPVYLVAMRGRRIVAAGRAIVERLGARPAQFRIYPVGDPVGATLTVTAAPTVLNGAQ